MAAPGQNVLSLYKSLIRAAEKFNGYNYRCYARRRIQDAFRQNKLETEPQKINSLIYKAVKDLEMIQRQVVISNMYAANPTVLDKVKQSRT